jgi:hypothetical protein
VGFQADVVRIADLTYLLPAVLLVTATLPVTVNRVLHHRRITHETVLGALCAYVLIGLLFAFLYLAVHELRDVLEALAGQIFLVTMVARLVTLWVRQSERVA